MSKQRTRSAIGRQNRAKGAAWERDVARMLAEIWPEAVRNLSQTRTARQEGPDILGTPYWIECKHGRDVDVRAAWEQGQRDVALGKPGTPERVVLVVKNDRRAPFVVWMLGGYRARVDLVEWLEAQAAGERARRNAA